MTNIPQLFLNIYFYLQIIKYPLSTVTFFLRTVKFIIYLRFTKSQIKRFENCPVSATTEASEKSEAFLFKAKNKSSK